MKNFHSKIENNIIKKFNDNGYYIFNIKDKKI